MSILQHFSLLILLAFLLDVLIGDPESRAHPIRFIGFLAKRFEQVLYPLPIPKKLSGAFFLLLVTLTLLGMSIGIYLLLASWQSIAGSAWLVFILWAGIAFRSLLQAGGDIAGLLQKRNIAAARKRLSLIVARDTNTLSQHDIIRGTIESLSENLNDGIIAPLFWAFLAGLPGIVVYKTVNTLDSLVGYKNKRYLDFGFASAKLDDLLNFIPARLTFLFVAAASFLLGLNTKACIRSVLTESQNGASPNGGIGICAFAGALSVQLGGLNYIEGKPVYTPYVGINKNKLTIATIQQSQEFIIVSTLLALAAFVATL